MRRSDRTIDAVHCYWIFAATLAAVLLPPAVGVADGAECSQRVRRARIAGELDRARQILEECAPDDEIRVSVELERIRLLAARGRADDALQRARELLETHPDHVGLRLLHIRLLKRAGKTGAALSTIEGFPDDLERPPELFKTAGILYVWNGAYERAVQKLDYYLDRDADDPAALYYRGIAHEHLGDSDRASADYRRSCDLAPRETKACAALHDLERRSSTEIYAYLQPGYSSVVDELDGWSLDGAVGTHLRRGVSVQGGMEWRVRSFGDERLDDLIATFQATRIAPGGLRLQGGGGVGIDPDFTPLWNAFAEVGYLFDGGIAPAFRFWRIQFPESGVSVLIPKATLYASPVVIDGQYYITLDDEAEVSLAGLLRGRYYVDYPSSISLGFGGGNRSDFIELRQETSESHLVFLGGVAWGISDRSTLGFDVVHRREEAGDRQYIQTQFLLKYQYTAPISRRR